MLDVTKNTSFIGGPGARVTLDSGDEQKMLGEATALAWRCLQVSQTQGLGLGRRGGGKVCDLLHIPGGRGLPNKLETQGAPDLWLPPVPFPGPWEV